MAALKFLFQSPGTPARFRPPCGGVVTFADDIWIIPHLAVRAARPSAFRPVAFDQFAGDFERLNFACELAVAAKLINVG